mgnify:CR=1 FL=1
MLASIFSLNVLQTALELGCIYALVALALFLSYSILNIADLSTDAASRWLRRGLSGSTDRPPHSGPVRSHGGRRVLRLCYGFSADPPWRGEHHGRHHRQHRPLHHQSGVMGFSSTMSLVKTDTVFSLAKGSLSFLGGWYKLAIALA